MSFRHISQNLRSRIRTQAQDRCGYCRLCNNYKGIKVDAIDPMTYETVPLFNPRTQSWAEHFQWSADQTQIMGKTAVGRATVLALQLNNIMAVSIRRAWVQAGWHPPHP